MLLLLIFWTDQPSFGLMDRKCVNAACEGIVIFEIIFGRYAPQGKLPIELPASVEAVTNQKEDMPYDSDKPLYPFGHGLSYVSLLGEKI